MRPAGPAKPHNRAGIRYLVRAVPKKFAGLDRRGTVKISTEIASPAIRGIHAARIVRQLGAYWRGLTDGQEGETRPRFEEAQRRARVLHLPYRTAAELADGPLDEILRRVNLLVDRGAIDDQASRLAPLALVLGLAGTMLSPRLWS